LSARSLACAAGLALLGVAAGVMIGAQPISPFRLVRILTDPGEPMAALFFAWRLPRVFGAFLVGACLSIAGVLFQGAFRNPLAEPYLLGSAAGGALGATFAILAPVPALSAVGLPLLAFLGAWGATLLVLGICRMARIAEAGGMLLVGIAVAALLGSIRSMATLMLSDESVSLRAVLSWTLGGLQTPTGGTLLAFALLTALCLLLALRIARGLDILGFGEETAATMGLDVGRFLGIALTLGALATGLTVAWGGVLGFVGLVVPHLVRWWVGARHAPLLLHASLLGGGLVALLDGLSRSLLPPSEIPLGLITALLGAPFFLLLLIGRAR